MLGWSDRPQDCPAAQEGLGWRADRPDSPPDMLVTGKPEAGPEAVGGQRPQTESSGHPWVLQVRLLRVPWAAQAEAQVSTRISTTWSRSPRSDLKLELGGGAAAEAKAWSPSPQWPATPVSMASRS